MKYLIFVIMILTFISCGKTQKSGSDLKPGQNDPKNEQPTDQKKELKGLKPNQTVIDAGDNMTQVFGYGYKQWTPSDDDIAAAEKLLNYCFDMEKSGTVDHFLDRKLEQYNRQFVGAINSKGEKIIWINCLILAGDNFKNWKTDIIMVNDGGNAFFNVRVNLITNTYYDLMINGKP